MARIIFQLLLLAALCLPAGARPGNPDRGMMIYSTYCAACHGEDGRGDGPVAARLARDHGITPADLTTPELQQRSSDAGLAKAIRQGGSGVHRSPYMPAWGLTLNDQQIIDLVSFVRELGETVPHQPPHGSFIEVQTQLELGRVLYGLYCASCHGNSGRGDGPFIEATQMQPPRSLADPKFYAERTDKQLGECIVSGTGHAHLSQPSTSWWQRPLDLKEVQALILYLRCLPLLKSP